LGDGGITANADVGVSSSKSRGRRAAGRGGERTASAAATVAAPCATAAARVRSGEPAGAAAARYRPERPVKRAAGSSWSATLGAGAVRVRAGGDAGSATPSPASGQPGSVIGAYSGRIATRARRYDVIKYIGPSGVLRQAALHVRNAVAERGWG